MHVRVWLCVYYLCLLVLEQVIVCEGVVVCILFMFTSVALIYNCSVSVCEGGVVCILFIFLHTCT